MLKTLVNIKIKEIFNGFFKGSKKMEKKGLLFKLLIGLFALYIIGSFFLLFGMLFSSLCKPLSAAGLSWLYFAFVGITVIALCFIGSVFAAKSQLYEAKDNELLLSMPIPPSYIMASRMLTLLLLNYMYEAFVVIPAVVIYFMNEPFSPVKLIILVATFLLLPLIAMALSCLVGWIIAAIGSRLRSKNLITMILSLGFLGAYFYFYSRIQIYITMLIQNGEAIGEAVKKGLFPIYHMGIAVAEGNLVSLLIFILFAVIPFVIAYVVLSRSFIKIATTKRGAIKIAYKERTLKVSSSQKALVRKELSHFISSPMYMMNAAIGVVFILAMAIALIVKKNDIMELIGMSPELEDFFGPIACVALSGLASSNFISAPSISLEGKNLWIAKSLPVDGGDILISKAELHMLVTLPPVIFTAIVCNLTLTLTPISRVLVFVLPSVVTAFSALFGVAVNLRFPKFDWLNETVAVKQGASSVISMFGTMALVALPTILYVALFKDMIMVETYMVVCTVIFVVLCFGLYKHLRTGGKRIFESL